MVWENLLTNETQRAEVLDMLLEIEGISVNASSGDIVVSEVLVEADFAVLTLEEPFFSAVKGTFLDIGSGQMQLAQVKTILGYYKPTEINGTLQVKAAETVAPGLFVNRSTLEITSSSKDVSIVLSLRSCNGLMQGDLHTITLNVSPENFLSVLGDTALRMNDNSSCSAYIIVDDGTDNEIVEIADLRDFLLV
mmetsp:Transcript_23005/g.35554  ORF Transcript_23005/g.35554 Transcript_23005/m.35554 type:complete len:193 (+) Transcript_23005:1268-1846(+)